MFNKKCPLGFMCQCTDEVGCMHVWPLASGYQSVDYGDMDTVAKVFVERSSANYLPKFGQFD